jgi:ABC-type nitrate/sulfonate/bicarbonate transport system substrate-binding protein
LTSLQRTVEIGRSHFVWHRRLDAASGEGANAMCKLRRALVQALILASALLLGPATQAAEKVSVGMTGPPTALGWPFEIAIAKGFFAAEGITIDRIAAPSSAAVVLQLTAGALDLSVQGAFVDVIRAIEKQAPLAIVRIMVQTPPYELLAKRSIKSIKELKGKTISIGGQKDVTHVYLNRMLEPNGLKDTDVDLVYAGASSARFNALESGAVDASMLTSPFNFKAADDGFPVVGRTADYITDMPQGGVTVNRNWAAGHVDTVRRFLAALNKGFDWFRDRRNREEAINILATAGKLKPEEVAKSYSFFRDGEFFEPTGNVSKAKLRVVIKVLHDLGDLPGKIDIDSMFLPGVTKVVD